MSLLLPCQRCLGIFRPIYGAYSANLYYRLEPAAENPLIPHLLAEPDAEYGIDHEFMTEATLRMQEDDSIREVLVNAVEDLSVQLAEKSMNDDYKPYISVSQTLNISLNSV